MSGPEQPDLPGLRWVRVDHSFVDDRARVSVEFPTDAATQGADGVAITMDDADWRGAAKRVLKECSAAERGLAPNVVVLRVQHALMHAVERALSVESDPDIARRRAVSGVLHQLADLVMAGTVRGFNVEWSSGEAVINAWYTTRRESCELSIPLAARRARAGT